LAYSLALISSEVNKLGLGSHMLCQRVKCLYFNVKAR